MPGCGLGRKLRLIHALLSRVPSFRMAPGGVSEGQACPRVRCGPSLGARPLQSTICGRSPARRFPLSSIALIRCGSAVPRHECCLTILRPPCDAVCQRSGLTSAEKDRIRELEREVRELRQGEEGQKTVWGTVFPTNEILKKASAYFAAAELDRPFRK